jgi:DNA-binding transcriptional MerR regulator
MTIGDVAAQTGLSVHTVRYYERIGLLDRVARDASGRRLFDDDDIGWLILLTKLRRTGMPIADMVRYAELVRGGPATHPQRLELLQRHRDAVAARIADLTDCLTVVDYKISNYRGAFAS